LIDAAIKLLAERGYAGTTLVEIGREAELSRGLVTHHFGTKEACMEAVIVAIRERLRKVIFSAVGETRGLAALEIMVDVYFKQLRSADAAARAMYTVLTEAVTGATGLRAATAENNAVFRGAIADRIVEAVEDGEACEQVMPQVSAILVEGAVRGIVAQWLISPGDVDLKVVVPELKHAIRRSMTAPQEPARPAKRNRSA
jgi:AcrR family transcriptional regulator